jgi:hypothetical protein
MNTEITIEFPYCDVSVYLGEDGQPDLTRLYVVDSSGEVYLWSACELADEYDIDPDTLWDEIEQHRREVS